MKRVLAAFVFLSGVARAEEPDRVVTLDQSLQTALQNSQALLSAREDVRIADQRVIEARSLFFPTLGLNMNASRYLADEHAVLSPEYGSTVLNPVSEPDNFFSGRLYLRQMLYNGGRSQANIRMAEAALAQARIKVEDIASRVKLDAVTAFYDRLLADRRLALGEEARRELEILARSARGDALAEAVLEAQASRLRRGQAERARQRDNAALAFSAVMGVELYTRIGVVGELTTAPVSLDLPKLLARAQESRLEIRGTEYQREIDRLGVNLSESERFPVVAFGAGYELGNTEFPLDRSYWNATLNVNLPLFDGFASRARIRQSRSAANQSRINRASIEDRINQEVREAYGDLIFWQAEMAERKADVERLNGLYAKLAGARAATDRAALRLEILEAADTYWTSVHGHRLARARLEKAVGMPL